MMKKILLIIFYLVPWIANATTYYVSREGNDTYDGLSPQFTAGNQGPWATLQKVNDMTFQPGDTIYFRRGDEWRGFLDIKSSGKEGAPITFDAYGSETTPKPIINVSELITGWTRCTSETCGNLPHLNNIYVATVQLPPYVYKPNSASLEISYEQGVAQLFVNGERYLLARHPNQGYLFNDSKINDNTLQITQADWDALPTRDLVGAHAHTKAMRWMFATNRVEEVDTTQRAIVLNGLASFGKGWGYILNNKLEMLDSEGEWYYDEITKKIYLWPRAGIDPNNARIEGSPYRLNVRDTSGAIVDQTIDGVNIEYDGVGYFGTYITVRNLHIKYPSGSGILGANGFLTLENNVIDYPTARGIEISLWNDRANQDNFIYIKNNVIQGADKGGIGYLFSGSEISGNVLSNIGRFEQLGKFGMAGMSPKGRKYIGSPHDDGIGIRSKGKNLTISRNSLDYIGHNGIVFEGTKYLIENNIINHACATKADCGGTYCYYGEKYSDEFANINVTLRNNIVMNTIGNTQGAKRFNPGDTGINYSIPFGMGIYVDGFARGVKVEKNIVFNTSYYGIEVHNSADVILTDNISFNNLNSQLHLVGDVRNVQMNRNTLYSLAKEQFAFFITKNEFLTNSDNNYFFNPYTRNAPSNYRDPYRYLISNADSSGYTLSGWQTVSGFDAVSKANWFELQTQAVSSVVGENLVNNGTFDTQETAKNWGWGVGWNASKIQNGTLELDRKGASYGISVSHKDTFELEQNKYYEIKFTAVSDKKTGPLLVSLRKPDKSDDPPILSESFVLTTDIKDYSFIFKAKETTPVKIFLFTSKEAIDLFWIDDLSVKEVSTYPLDAQTNSTVDENGYPPDFRATLFPLKAILFYNKTLEPRTVDLQGITYRTLNNLRFSEDPAVAAFHDNGQLKLAPMSGIVLLVDQITSPKPIKITVAESATHGQIIGQSLYTLMSEGYFSYFEENAWKTLTLNQLGTGLPPGGFSGKIASFLYMKRGDNILPPGSLIVVNDQGKVYLFIPGSGWMTFDFKPITALFSIPSGNTEMISYLEGNDIVIHATGARISLKSLGFPSTEPVKIISRDESGLFYYLVTTSNRVFIYDISQNQWSEQK